MKIPETTEECPHILVELNFDGEITLGKTTRPTVNYKDYNEYLDRYETTCYPRNVKECIMYLISQRQKSIKKHISRLEKQINRLEKIKEKWKNTSL